MSNREAVDRSHAGPGVGVESPENVAEYNVTRAGKRVAVIIRWDGNEYDSERCWLRGEADTVIDLDTIL